MKYTYIIFLICCAISVRQGASSESDDETGDDGVSAKAFLKKKPEGVSEASKFLKSAKGSGVRNQLWSDGTDFCILRSLRKYSEDLSLSNRMSRLLVMKMKMMRTGAPTLKRAAVRVQMMKKGRASLWPRFSSRSELSL